MSEKARGRMGKAAASSSQQQQRQKKKKKLRNERNRVVAAAEEKIQKWAGIDRITSNSFDLHVHTTCSDGHLSPEQVMARAFRNGVRILSLTDHDTMAGVPAASGAARQHGIRLIPGIEISAKNLKSSFAVNRHKAGIRVEEPVHILAYYGECGPCHGNILEDRLQQVRDGRYRRAQEMVDKLAALNAPIKFERVLRLAGKGVAPGRPHVARALVEAGHASDFEEAFVKYIGNDGPAYAAGAEIPVEEAVELIRKTGGVSALAHPWTVKDPLPLVRRLKRAGLHAMEVYRGDGMPTGFGVMAEDFGLVKLGGSDYHGRGSRDEVDLGSVALPILAMHQFLKVAEPIWSSAADVIRQGAQG